MMMSSLAPPQVVVDSPRPQLNTNTHAELAAGIALLIRPPSSGQSLSTCGASSRKNSQKRKSPGASGAPLRKA